MPAVKAVRALLLQSAPVAALVADRCGPDPLPEGELPGVVLSHVSTFEVPVLNAAAGPQLMRSRVQCMCLAGTYPQLKQLVAAAGAACNRQRGDIAGVRVVSVQRDLIGPDGRDDDRTVHHQPIDFIVIYYE